jgi:Tfp pilus assembly protein PilO
MNGQAWREHPWWWGPPLALLAVNLVLLVWFQAVYSGAARNVEQQLERRRAELASLAGVLSEQRDVVERVRTNREEVEAFYSVRLATSQERLTGILREVRRLAETAGLSPSAVNYPEDELEEFGLEKRGVTFGVEGSYVALRRFVNLLELSESFLTLEEVNLSGRATEGVLRINLRLSTLFSTRTPEEAMEASSP